MQTKYPWNLEVEVDGGEWNGEYYMEFANTERWTAIGKERIEEGNEGDANLHQDMVNRQRNG